MQTQNKKDPALPGQIKVSEGGVEFCEAESTAMWVGQAAGCRVRWEQSDIKADAVLGWQTLWVASQDPDPCWTQVFSHIDSLLFICSFNKHQLKMPPVIPAGNSGSTQVLAVAAVSLSQQRGS